MGMFNREDLVPDRIYRDAEDGTYFVSPDGEGCFYYDTLADLVAEWGEPDRVYVVTLGEGF